MTTVAEQNADGAGKDLDVVRHGGGGVTLCGAGRAGGSSAERHQSSKSDISHYGVG